MQKRVKSNIRKIQKVGGTKLLTETDTKSAWNFKFIREITFTTKKDPPSNISSTVVNNFFATTLQTSLAEHVNLPDLCYLQDSFRFTRVSHYQVERMLNHLKVNTATGPDDLPAFYLKNLVSEIRPNIQSIINSSIQTGQVPELWKEGDVSAIWKNKGSKSDPSNYRAILVLPVLTRMMEKEDARQLTRYLNRKDIIPAQQFGFREKSSCEIALL